MNTEQKRKLRNISLLALVGLIGGTFAFQAFNQQAINDRLRDNEVEVGGRVHDYYNRDTENKDVFVENFGQEEIMARIRLSEFMEIQHRGSTEFEPEVPGSSRDDVTSWTTWRPEADNINLRQSGTDSAVFNDYSSLTLGWERDGQFAPWYLPTFNLIEDDERTAAAGHARDWAEVGGDEGSVGATNGTTDGATHPGDGTDGYWSEGESYNNSEGDWFGSQVTRETAQNLAQERAPMTMDQWVNLDNRHKVGDFWVVDQNTGWAYWASKLQAGETTSYLLDAAEMTEQADAINGSYYYGIHVESNLVSPDHREDFEESETGLTHHEHLGSFLEAVENGAVDIDWPNQGANPPADENAQADAFNFELMNPGRLFMMDNQQFRYLENMGDGNHLIIRNAHVNNVDFNAQASRLTTWYNALAEEVKSIFQPVSNNFITGSLANESVTFDGPRWLPNNLNAFPEVAQDETRVVQGEGASPQAFSLSLADVTRLSQKDSAFTTPADRTVPNDGWWWLRTPGASDFAWVVARPAGSSPGGGLSGAMSRNTNTFNGGIRPALIVNNSTD